MGLPLALNFRQLPTQSHSSHSHELPEGKGSHAQEKQREKSKCPRSFCSSASLGINSSREESAAHQFSEHLKL